MSKYDSFSTEELEQTVNIKRQILYHVGNDIELAEEIDEIQSVLDSRHEDQTFELDLVREYDDHEPILLGEVTVLAQNKDHAQEIILRYWEKFEETEPEVDSDFVQYLEERGFNVKFKPERDKVILQ